MKTLKFMLAAATAIGLASATQADQYNTTGFEKLTVGDSVTTGVQDNRSGYSYFYYAGSVAEDNESVIAAADAELANIGRPRGASAVDAGRDKILQVSTGTDPLLRTYQGFTGSAPVAATELAGDVYVDTLVQFTVTPYTDPVTPGSADKLMIYLKETTNEVGGVTTYTTNLVVVGGCVVGAEDTLAAAQEYVVQGFHVDGQHQDCSFAPNTWYRLTVKVIANAGGRSGTYPGFCVYVDGKLCYFDVAAWNEENKNFRNSEYESANTSKELVLSLLANGSNVASLQGVGFAGEGKVDDIVFGTVDPFATVYDFTFAFDAQKVTAVTYTVGGVEYDQARTFPEVEADTEVQITSITYAQGWQAGSTNVVNLTPGLTEGLYTVTGAGASLTIVPAEKQGDEWVDDPTEITPASKTAAEQYTSLAGTKFASANARALTTWAKDTTKGNVDLEDLPADNDTYVEAFLLNCAPVAATVAQEKDEFVANITFENGVPVVTPPANKTYNGTLQLKGKEALTDADWTNVNAASTDYNFYMYELGF
ncbi:MAG: hypothetical protein IKO81_02290 [Bacteroidales bacterium]|nr:hypothetical protein [Bacteroidales bacterium]